MSGASEMRTVSLMPKKGKLATNVASTVVAGVADMAKSGSFSSTTLSVAIAKNTAGLAGLSEDEKLQCMAALLDAGVALKSAASQAGLIGAEEAVTEGLATPLIQAQAANAALTIVDAANAAIKAGQQCGPLAAKGYQSLGASWAEIQMRGGEAIKRLEECVQQSVEANSKL